MCISIHLWYVSIGRSLIFSGCLKFLSKGNDCWDGKAKKSKSPNKLFTSFDNSILELRADFTSSSVSLIPLLYSHIACGVISLTSFIFIVIFDLLPQVYRKAYKPGKNVINVDFKVEKKGKKTAAGHFGKAVKGKFIRFLAENSITDTKDFSGFNYDGFEWVDNDHFVKVIND